MNFNLKQLEAFVWVSDLGSFRKAADRLNTTQPNISTRISSLENTLNVKLMERDAGSVRLTTKGQELLKHARKVLVQSDEFLSAVNQNTLHNETIRIGVTEMIVHTWLRSFLKRLKNEYPKLSVELTVDLSNNLKSELFSRSTDMAFQNGPFQRQTSGFVDLGTYAWIWVASPQLGISGTDTVSVADMLEFPILTHSRDTHIFTEIEQYFTNHGEEKPRFVSSSNLATCLFMAVEGMGISAIPKAMVTKELENGELVQLLHDWMPSPLEFRARFDLEKSPAIVARTAELAAQTAHDFSLTIDQYVLSNL
ncbi:MAG: LysR family transcriptional regulator [Pseudomonadota bacterium]